MGHIVDSLCLRTLLLTLALAPVEAAAGHLNCAERRSRRARRGRVDPSVTQVTSPAELTAEFESGPEKTATQREARPDGSLPTGRWNLGARDGVRTRDPQLGKLMLYQLSYSRVRVMLAEGRKG